MVMHLLDSVGDKRLQAPCINGNVPNYDFAVDPENLCNLIIFECSA